MAPIYAGVFFTRTKTSGVVRSKDLLGKVEVGHVLKARWNGRVYAAKVVCVGSKKYCESQLPHILTDGSLITPEFEICEGSVGTTTTVRESHAGDGLDTLKCLLEDIKIRLDAVSARQERLEVLFKQEGQRQRHHWDDICEMKGALEELLRRVPKRIYSEGALLYEYVDRERLEALRRLSGGNMNHFALELEKDVYIDEPEELAVKVENRVRTSTRVDYIKECIFKYYLVPIEAREIVWRTVKNALNSRVRRLKCAARNISTVQVQRDIF